MSGRQHPLSQGMRTDMRHSMVAENRLWHVLCFGESETASAPTRDYGLLLARTRATLAREPIVQGGRRRRPACGRVVDAVAAGRARCARRSNQRRAQRLLTEACSDKKARRRQFRLVCGARRHRPVPESPLPAIFLPAGFFLIRFHGPAARLRPAGVLRTAHTATGALIAGWL